VIPTKSNAGFVAAMEDVLEVYHRPHDPARPVVCLDETSKQLTAETRTRIAATPDIQNDTITNIHATERPICSWCSRPWRVGGMSRSPITIPHRLCRNPQGYIRQSLPEAEKIVLVQDNLNTHKPASLYEAFPAEETRRPVERFEWHYTPKHGSWLDMAESELSVLSGQCLNRRIPDKQTLTDEVAAWEARRQQENIPKPTGNSPPPTPA